MVPRRRARVSSLAKRLAAHHAAGLDTAPLERFQHGQELAAPTMSRGPHAIAHHAETLFGLGSPEAEACDRFHRDFVLGLMASRQDGTGRDAAGDGQHVLLLAHCHALDAHQALTELLGPYLTGLAVAVIVDDLSFRALDRRFPSAAGERHKEMSGRVWTLLQMMPGLYRMVDRQHGRTRRAADPQAGTYPRHVPPMSGHVPTASAASSSGRLGGGPGRAAVSAPQSPVGPTAATAYGGP